MYFNEERKKVRLYKPGDTMGSIAMLYDEIYIMDDRLVKNWRKNKSKFNG